jgi:GNAT superfamily N-acetyltransferase
MIIENRNNVGDDFPPEFADSLADAFRLTPDGRQGNCTLWFKDGVPTLPGERLGIIGDYSAATEEEGRAILDEACAFLKTRGCTLAVGPMNGNTWRSYRFVTESDTTEPPFFLEPTNPPDYPIHWENAGFTPLAQYSSALTDDLTVSDPRVERVSRRLTEAGVTLRSVDMSRAEDDLRAIHTLSLTSFENNYLYTPLALPEFLEQYKRILPYVRPELTVLAHSSDGNLVGFLFAIPDLNEVKRGTPSRTIIVKTAAVLPGRLWAGLGMLLLDHCQKAAQTLGFTRAIHALMHDSNASRNVSGAYAGHTIRRYSLYARRLTETEEEK